MKTIAILCIVLFPAINSFAQQVVASAGNTGTMTGYVVDWTLGEPVIETFPGVANTLTQGMHQTKLLVTAIVPVEIPGLEIKVYPNPTGSFLNVEITRTGDKLLLYELFDISGRKLALQETGSNTGSIDMRSYAAGIYFLNVKNHNQAYVKTFKIIKN